MSNTQHGLSSARASHTAARLGPSQSEVGYACQLETGACSNWTTTAVVTGTTAEQMRQEPYHPGIVETCWILLNQTGCGR